jgi:hypothetical protein
LKRRSEILKKGGKTGLGGVCLFSEKIEEKFDFSVVINLEKC